MSKKRYFAAFGAAGVVFAGVYGAAASLGVDGGAIQVGQDGSLACTSGTATVESYLFETNGATSHGVRVTGLEGCENEELVASVFHGDTFLADGLADINGGEVVVHWDNPVSAEKITKVQLAID